MIITILGWTGNILFLLGAWLLSNRKRLGFVCNLIANSLYFVIGILLPVSSLWAISLVLTILNIKGIINWKRK